MAVQAALDRNLFSPNCIDGFDGIRTRYAIEAWQLSRGYACTGVLTETEWAALTDNQPATVPYEVTPDDLANLAAIPSTWLGKSQLSEMGYETVLEKISEKFHTSQAALRRLNPHVNWPNPPAGTGLLVPNIGKDMRAQAARLEISLSRKYIRAFDPKDRVIGHFPCSIAARVEKRPRGDIQIVTAARRPDYTFDPALFSDDSAAVGIKSKLIIPPGPNNPVGLAWISLNLPGYGMHGTPRPEDIGRTESHGCFRLANWNAERLLRMVTAGLPVCVEE